ncbi:proteoglycan Cow isoform X2 [Panulirus ornatus]|uniref:proteoglycan Cow isoform X2 n=1 Tax=Panulirus ornatus TaxID=150431 RepID=UPI003A87313D
MVAMKAVVVLLVGLLVVCEAKKKDGVQEDFEFVEDGKDHSGAPSSGERRTWMLDPDNALCGLLRCGRREVCLLQDRFTAVCVNKAEVTRNGQCPSCPVVRPVFLCGSDNRTYSSLCRLHYHNCIHDANVRITCKGFCPCKDPNSHAAKKDRQRERLDAYINKLRTTKGEANTPALSSASPESPSSSSSSTASSSSAGRADDLDNTTRGRLRDGQQQGRNRENGGRRDKHNREGGDKFTNRVRSRLAKVKGNKNNDHSNSNYSKYSSKYNKDGYRQTDKYNVQRRQWSRRNNDATHKATNTVWGPNECTQDALEAMGNRMLDWFSVIMADSRSRSNPVNKAPAWCKPEVSWMLGHLDGDSDGRLSVKELYQLEHDDHERCIKPFIDRCDLDRDIFLSAREWCKCFDKSERPCAALRKASKGLLGGYIPECDSEGYYQPTQCHAGAGVCWCVDRHGVELRNTRTRGTPNCDAIVSSEEVSNRVDDDAEEGDDEMDMAEGSADMPLDI